MEAALSGRRQLSWRERCPYHKHTSGRPEYLNRRSESMIGEALSDRPSLLELARRRVVVLDGAMGTSIHTYPLELQRDWLGLENCSEILIQTRPDVVREIHESFLA